MWTGNVPRPCSYHIRLLSAVAAFGLAAQPLQAAIDWRLAVDMKSFDYREFHNGQLLDLESGWLPGLAGALDWRQGKWSLTPEVAWHSGQVDYDGQTQTGIPHDTDTDTELLRYGLTAGYLLPATRWHWRLTAAFQRMQWQRDIRPNNGVSGLKEDYRWNEGSLGLQFALPNRSQEPWQLHLQYLLIDSPQLEVKSDSEFDPVTFALGERHGWRVSFTVPLTAGGRWSLQPYWERWRFGQSDSLSLTRNGQDTSWLAMEPESLSEHWGLQLVYRFTRKPVTSSSGYITLASPMAYNQEIADRITLSRF